MKLRRRVRHTSNIPTASMADIAMLLLIFFLSTTIIRAQAAIEVKLPGVTAGDRFHREDALRIWLGPAGEVAVNDARLSPEALEPLVASKLLANPRLLISLHADGRAPYAEVARVLDLLQEARAPRVVLAGTKRERP